MTSEKCFQMCAGASRRSALLGLTLLATTTVGRAADIYDIQLLGLVDREHTQAGGYRHSSWIDLNDKGDAIGLSFRYAGGTTSKGRSAWFFNGKETVKIGLTGGAFLRADGYSYNQAKRLNDRGDVIGTASIYKPNNPTADAIGITTWIYDGETSREIGLTGPGYVSSSGARANRGSVLNNKGEVAGTATRFSGSTNNGQSAWFYSKGQTVEIGPLGPDARDATGASNNEVFQMNDLGQVIGYGRRYDGNTYLGRVAWRYWNGGTELLGFVDAAHTRADGYRESRPTGINAHGSVIGTSHRWSGNQAMGLSAWLFDGAKTTDIGLHDDQHRRADGYEANGVSMLDDFGRAVGFAQRFSGASSAGESIWLYDGKTTRRIGLVDADHTRSGNWQFSSPIAFSSSGEVIGISEQRQSSGGERMSAWLYRDEATRKIGLYSGVWIDPTGGAVNIPMLINKAGQVTGEARRFAANGADAGSSAWFYDPKTDVTTPLEFSVLPDGSASTHVIYLADDGTALGQYMFYEGQNLLSYHAFAWTAKDGFTELGSLVSGGLSQLGWATLYEGIKSNGRKQIIGHGQFFGPLDSLLISEPAAGLIALSTAASSDLVYLLTPVPEPSSHLAILLCATAFGARRHRHSTVGACARQSSAAISERSI